MVSASQRTRRTYADRRAVNAKVQASLGIAGLNSPRLIPLHCGVIHLVDDNNETADTQGFGQQSMLASLTTALKTSLKLALTSRDNLLTTGSR